MVQSVEEFWTLLSLTNGATVMRHVPAGLVVVFAVGVVQAGSIQDEPYALRLTLALSRQSNYAATVGRQASVAVTQASSANPAADDWLYRSDHPVIGTITAINGFSESGAWIAALAGTVSIQTPEAGTWSIAYARTDTFNDTARNGFEDELRSNEFFLGYGKKLTDTLAIGAQLHVIEGQIQEENLQTVDGVPIQVPLRIETDILSFDVSLGLTLKLDEDWTAGVSGGWGYGKGDSSFQNISSGLDPNPFPPPAGTIRGGFDDDLRTWSFVGGVGYMPTDQWGIYADVQYLHLESNQAGAADLGRVSLGFEMRPVEVLVLRAGVLVDSDGQTTLSAGVGFFGWGFPLEVGYQFNSSPEVKREFGTFHLISVSLVIPF